MVFMLKFIILNLRKFHKDARNSIFLKKRDKTVNYSCQKRDKTAKHSCQKRDNNVEYT